MTLRQILDGYRLDFVHTRFGLDRRRNHRHCRRHLRWANGAVAGISGIVGGILRPAAGSNVAWRIAFIAGLMVAPIFFAAAAPLPPVEIGAGYPTLVVAGLLVGIGTRYAGGCTSGHGVCGISRLSPRSMVATLAFMAAGVATVFVARHLIGG